MATSGTRPTIVITGASDGIGAVAARELAGPDVDLVIVGRSAEKLERVAKETGATAFRADFAKFDDVRALAEQINAHTDRIDVLANNAGGTFVPSQHTPDGHEPNFQINHLAPFLLTHLLRDRLVAAGTSLVVNTSSIGNLMGRVRLDDLEFRRHRAIELQVYGTSKLMNIMFTRGISQRWSGEGIMSAAVHPGVVSTSFGRDSALIGLLYRTPLRHVGAITPDKGAAPLVELIRRGPDPALDGVYFHRHRARGPVNPQARDQRLVDGLWAASSDIVGV